MSTKFKVGDVVFIKEIAYEELTKDPTLNKYLEKVGTIIKIDNKLHHPYTVRFEDDKQDFFENELVINSKNVKILFGK